MKATINRKTYDTDTATIIASDSNDLPINDFGHWSIDLYLTAKGAYFTHGQGGPMSSFAETCGNESRSGEKIQTLTVDQALRWCEDHQKQESIDKHFFDMIEDA